MSSFLKLEASILRLPFAHDVRESLTKSSINSYKKRIPSRVSQLVIHHSAHPSWTVYEVANYHVKSNKWPAIGYHVVIDQKGNVFICNSLDNQSYHCKDNNFKSIGICLLGNFEEHFPSSEQMIAAESVINCFALNFHELVLFKHSDLGATLCPGKNLNFNILKLAYDEGIRYKTIEM